MGNWKRATRTPSVRRPAQQRGTSWRMVNSSPSAASSKDLYLCQSEYLRVKDWLPRQMVIVRSRSGKKYTFLADADLASALLGRPVSRMQYLAETIRYICLSDREYSALASDLYDNRIKTTLVTVKNPPQRG